MDIEKIYIMNKSINYELIENLILADECKSDLKRNMAVHSFTLGLGSLSVLMGMYNGISVIDGITLGAFALNLYANAKLFPLTRQHYNEYKAYKNLCKKHEEQTLS